MVSIRRISRLKNKKDQATQAICLTLEDVKYYTCKRKGYQGKNGINGDKGVFGKVVIGFLPMNGHRFHESPLLSDEKLEFIGLYC